ncbi:MAG: tRNA (adenosine(37)-N6)-threonylcarbamoyltransferase complex transferase subunit TsaD, partial [Planctomycetes bacterium]|nr:tRNA (adenosine(37)-N6)-threonylcarbamoyltransferase complex transferase subunit TsaD [Planctomycetota bacterium]
ALDVPLVAVNHLHAHVYACRLVDGPGVFPCVALIVSGGHTSLYRCGGPLEFELLGGTIDDAAGEAFDKVAAMLRLPYPGGPSIEKAAAGGNPKAHRFPRSLLADRERLEFSFSGLKTAVRYAISPPGGPEPSEVELSAQQVADLAASFQQAVIDCLAGKALSALAKTGLDVLCLAGGVAANGALRERLQHEARQNNFDLHTPPIELCTDNAVMGAIAVERIKAGLFEPLDLDIAAGLVRGPR